MLREDLPWQRDAALAAMDAAEWAKARDIVHTVNGSASFCRLQELQSAAAALEFELKDRSAKSETRELFRESIERVILMIG
ncbi:MAG: Hpt domain-containing protein [Xanthomonadales bacterium]|nr:Hpt domain-containing protein [Xanthomonadales bacterium]